MFQIDYQADYVISIKTLSTDIEFDMILLIKSHRLQLLDNNSFVYFEYLYLRLNFTKCMLINDFLTVK